jgi:hypothetical protein
MLMSGKRNGSDNQTGFVVDILDETLLHFLGMFNESLNIKMRSHIF